MKANSSAGLVQWLKDHDVSLAFSTYRANRLIFLGRDDQDQLKLHERLFDRPMGLYVDDQPHGQSLWMATRCQLWRFDNFLAEGQRHEGGDRLYVPAASFTTGDVNAHEVVIQPDGQPLFVNTAFSCLAGIQPGVSFAPSWQPPFIKKLAAEDRCHLNGLAMVDGVPTWATACGSIDQPAGWRDQRDGGGVLLHIPTNRIAVTGLAMPHSPRWHEGKLWLLNSGTGEFGHIDGDQFAPVCQLPGFARGLAFVGGTAVVGLSKLRSPQFTGLPLEQRLIDSGITGGCCGLRVIDLATGAILHSLDLPEPIDELFDVVVINGAQQPRALGLQAEDIHCLVRLPGHEHLVTVRPKAPSGNPHQAEAPPLMGLPQPGQYTDAATANAAAAQAMPATASTSAIRYQQVFQLTPQTLAPYAALTFPSLAPGGRALAAITGELLAVSAMADGVMVGMAVAERHASGKPEAGSRLCSLMVEPAWRRRGIATRMVLNLQRFLAQLGVTDMGVRYRASPAIASSFEPLLQRLHWAPPQTEFVLIQGERDKLASTGWNTRYALKPPYEVFTWANATNADVARTRQIGARPDLLPPPTLEGLDTAISLGLRHQGALVGWLIAHRVDAATVRYSSLYVAPKHRSRGQGLALLAEGFGRQQQAGIPKAKAAISSGNDAFLRVFRRHLQAYLSGAGESRSSRASLAAALAPPVRAE